MIPIYAADRAEAQTSNLTKVKVISDDGTVVSAARKKTEEEDAAVDGVSLNISDEGKKKLGEQEALLETLQMQLENTKEQVKAQEEAWDSMGKCLAIAIRIVKGDNVPTQDIEYLKEKNPDLFMQSMSLRMPKKDPEDCDSVLGEEEDEEASGEDGAKAVLTGESSAADGESSFTDASVEKPPVGA